MSKNLWSQVDDYLGELFAPEDEALKAAIRDCQAAGLPDIAVTANQGKLLHVFAKVCAAKKILEIGTLGAYSTIWMARALPPDGQLVTLEIESKHAAVARANLARAGVDDAVRLIEGPAIDSLAQLAAEYAGPFDLVFIDANKDQIPEYFEGSLKLARPGSFLVVDNVVREGAILDPQSDDESVIGCRRLFDNLAKDARVSATVVQTVGEKGHDGFVLAVVKS